MLGVGPLSASRTRLGTPALAGRVVFLQPARDLVLLVTLVALVLAALGAGLIPVAPHLGSPDAWFL
jgi:hypothetical protein